MTPALGATRVGNAVKEIRQAVHLFRGEHDIGGSCELKARSIRLGQLRLRMAAQRTHKDPLGGVCGRAVAVSGASIALGQSQFDPVGGTIDATVEAARIDKGLQQQQRMTKACPPITDDSAFGQ